MWVENSFPRCHTAFILVSKTLNISLLCFCTKWPLYCVNKHNHSGTQRMMIMMIELVSLTIVRRWLCTIEKVTPLAKGAEIWRWSELSRVFPLVKRDVGGSLGAMKLYLLREDDRMLAYCNCQLKLHNWKTHKMSFIKKLIYMLNFE